MRTIFVLKNVRIENKSKQKCELYINRISRIYFTASGAHIPHEYRLFTYTHREKERPINTRLNEKYISVLECAKMCKTHEDCMQSKAKRSKGMALVHVICVFRLVWPNGGENETERIKLK